MKFLVWLGVSSILFFTASGFCPSGWVNYGNNCYYIFESPVDRHDAEIVCKRHESYLVSFRDEKEKSAVSGLLKLLAQRHGEMGVWSGLRHIPATWAWEGQSRQDGPRDGGSGGKGKVVYFGIYVRNHTVVINDTATDTLLHPFCKRKYTTVDSCDYESGWMLVDGECYKLFEEVPPDNILSNCESNDASPFTPLGPRDIRLLAAMTPENQTVWANGKRVRAGSSKFRTDYGATHTYLPWLQDPQWNITKEEDCLVVARTPTSTGFLTVKCDEPTPYICIKPQGTCPLGWHQIGQACYRWHLRPEDKVAWFTARGRCIEDSSEMIEPNDPPKVDEFLRQKLVESGTQDVWLQYTEPVTSDAKANRYKFCGVTDFESPQHSEYCFGTKNYICRMSVFGASVAERQDVDVCPDGWDKFNGRCFKFLSRPSNQEEAMLACEQENATLPLVMTDEEQSFVAMPSIMNGTHRSLWLGARRVQDYHLQNEEKIHYSNGPTNVSRDKPCVYVNTGRSVSRPGLWIHDNCSQVHDVLCMKNALKLSVSMDDFPYGLPVTWSNECGPGWLYNNKTDGCYWVEKYVMKSWQEARLTCQTMSSELLSIENWEEQEFVSSLLQQPDYRDVTASLWIGIGDGKDGEASEWAWSDHTPFEFTHWKGDQPVYDKQCVKIPYLGEFYWQVGDCLTQSPYICKKYAHLRQSAKRPTEIFGSGLSIGALTGIVIALILLCILVGILILCKKGSLKRSEEYEDMEKNKSENKSGENGTGNDSKATENTNLSLSPL